jgi:hypothetical protein
MTQNNHSFNCAKNNFSTQGTDVKYHNRHHVKMGDILWDYDCPTRLEGRTVNSILGCKIFSLDGPTQNPDECRFGFMTPIKLFYSCTKTLFIWKIVILNYSNFIQYLHSLN